MPQTVFGPQVPTFHAEDLESRINTLPNGKRRKPAITDITKECQLLKMPQYNCDVVQEGKQKIVQCREFERLFRRCANGLMVETTQWEMFE